MSNHTGSRNSRKDLDGIGIKTLFIRPFTEKLRRGEILSHFSTFGDVQHVRIRNKSKCSYGFVNFSLPASAAKALEVDLHVIAGHRIKIAAASDIHQNWTTLLDLNDDCIFEVLSMKCLSINDLCSVAETCRRLKEIAGRVFKREHTTWEIYPLSAEDVHIAKRTLMNFGSVISRLKISGEDNFGKWSGKLLDYVTEYCGPNLQSLHLEDFVIPVNFATKLRPTLNNLHRLAILDCTFKGTSTELLAECGSLVELKIRLSGSEAEFLYEKTFSKLQQFNCHFGADSNSLESFLSRHTNLQSLIVYNLCSGSSLMQRIADCKRLETLICHIIENATLDLSNHGHLREVTINCHHHNVMKTAVGLHTLKCLEHLTLGLAEIDAEFIRTLPQVKTLKVLKLCWCTGLQNLNQMGDFGQLTTLEISSDESVDLDVVRLIRRLSKLNYLRVEVRGFDINLATYLKIVDVVRRRRDRSTLTIRLARFGFDYDHLAAHFALNSLIVHMIIDSYW